MEKHLDALKFKRKLLKKTVDESSVFFNLIHSGKKEKSVLVIHRIVINKIDYSPLISLMMASILFLSS